MGIFVQKYGGSSLADLDKLKLVAENIAKTKRDGHDVVVVVSAMGGTTDDLLALANGLSAEPSRRELDMLLSVGERISMTLVSMALHAMDLKAISLTGSQCGIITTASHTNARIMDVRPFRIQDELKRGRIVIVAGFQGTSYKREVTTLGRGGSDTTAVALAAALGAEACEIYSDVDGIYSGDPRTILSAKKLSSLSHDEMLELSRSGATVLNADAVAFAKAAKIALYAKATAVPDASGTIIRPDGFFEESEKFEAGAFPVAVSHVHEGLFVSGDDFRSLADRRLACLGAESAFVLLDDVHDPDQLAHQLSRDGCTSQIAGLVSLIGVGIGLSADFWWDVRRDVDALDTFIMPDRISWVVSTENVDGIANTLHDRVR